MEPPCLGMGRVTHKRRLADASLTSRRSITTGASQSGAPRSNRPAVPSGAHPRDVLRGWTLLTLHDVELDRLAFGKRLEAASLNRRMMDETILLAIGTREEAEALRVIEPLDRSV